MKIIDGFFYHIGRYIFLVPLVVIVIVVTLKFTKPTQLSVPNTEIISPTVTLLSAQVNTIQTATTSAVFDVKTLNLIGPWYCPYNDQTASVSAYISNRRARADIATANTTTHIVFLDDCYYSWKEREKTGEMMCGLKQVVSMVEPLLQSGVLNLSQLGGLAKQYINTSASSIGDVTKYMQNCSKKPVKEELFRYPTDVKWQKK